MKLEQYGTFRDLTEMSAQKYGPLPIITVKELRQSGANLGVGAAVGPEGHLEGEVTLIDGVAYVTSKGGTPRIMEDHETLGFAQFANVTPEDSFTQEITATTPEALFAQCRDLLAAHTGDSGNGHAFALRVRGNFDGVDYRGMVNDRAAPHENFATMEHEGSTHHLANTRFTMSGIFQDQLPDGKSPEGWHLHGLDNSRANGGHITNFSGFNGEVDIIPIHEWHISTHAAIEARSEPSTAIRQTELYRFPSPPSPQTQQAAR